MMTVFHFSTTVLWYVAVLTTVVSTLNLKLEKNRSNQIEK